MRLFTSWSVIILKSASLEFYSSVIYCLEKEMSTHASILAWRILWTEEPGGLLSMESHRVGHDWSGLACMCTLEKEMATHSSILSWRLSGTEEPGGLLSMGVTQSRTQLNWLSSSRSIYCFTGDFFYGNVIGIKWDNVCNGSIYCPAHMNNSVKGRYCFYWEKYEKCLVLCEYSINKSVNTIMI